VKVFQQAFGRNVFMRRASMSIFDGVAWQIINKLILHGRILSTEVILAGK
jgi:hypothetical protein